MSSPVSLSPQEKAQQFLKVASHYQLGALATEASHPKTKKLASLAQNNLDQAVELLREVDLDALELFGHKLGAIESMMAVVQDTLAKGNKIFLCGCGATGRLSLSLEYLWRRRHQGSGFGDRVISFMAGGDTALVHALEGFEDYPAFGAKQLQEAGFVAGDLLISTTEGGETPFVIGATEEAATKKGPRPYFLYCNPDSILRDKVERSQLVLDNPKIEKINLYVGPMALAGSTRMQASTVLMLAVGMALFWEKFSQAQSQFQSYADHFAKMDLTQLPHFIEREASIYEQGGHLLYHAEEMAITVFTDTTERAPTFSQMPFENQKFPGKQHSLSYIAINSTNSAMESWQKLLARPARPLNWGNKFPQTNQDYLDGFDFSRQAGDFRRNSVPGDHVDFVIEKTGDHLLWELQDLKAEFPLGVEGELFHHLLLKKLLNIHSTLIMGRLDRYRQNFMTWVVPTNGKLIDRAARYIKWLLEENGTTHHTYEEIVTQLFQQQETLKPHESIVIKVYETLKT